MPEILTSDGPASVAPGDHLGRQSMTSVIMPPGFFWPHLWPNTSGSVNNVDPKSGFMPVLGWTMPAVDILSMGAEWLGEDKYVQEAGPGHSALLIGFDPSLAVFQLFHFCQALLPAFAARTRLAWKHGIRPTRRLPSFAEVLLADPANVLQRNRWARGLFTLVVGAGARITSAYPMSAFAEPRLQRGTKSTTRVRCFRQAVLTGWERRTKAATGRADHAALYLEAGVRIASEML